MPLSNNVSTQHCTNTKCVWSTEVKKRDCGLLCFCFAIQFQNCHIFDSLEPDGLKFNLYLKTYDFWEYERQCREKNVKNSFMKVRNWNFFYIHDTFKCYYRLFPKFRPINWFSFLNAVFPSTLCGFFTVYSPSITQNRFQNSWFFYIIGNNY